MTDGLVLLLVAHFLPASAHSVVHGPLFLLFQVVKDRITDPDCGPRAFVVAALAQPFPRREPWQRWRKMKDET